MEDGLREERQVVREDVSEEVTFDAECMLVMLR